MCLFGYREGLVLFDFNVVVHLRNHDWSSSLQKSPSWNSLNCVLFVLFAESCLLLWANMKCIWCVCLCAHMQWGRLHLLGIWTCYSWHPWSRMHAHTARYRHAHTGRHQKWPLFSRIRPPPAHCHHCHCQHQQCHHDNAPCPVQLVSVTPKFTWGVEVLTTPVMTVWRRDTWLKVNHLLIEKEIS